MMKRELLLWVEWQTLARHFTDDEVVLGEWFTDIMERYSQTYRSYHSTEYLYQMVLNYREFYQELTYPRTILFAIFFHNLIYDPQNPDEDVCRCIEEFESCAEDLNLDSELVGDVRQMIELAANEYNINTQEHNCERPHIRDIHYFLDMKMAILGSNPVEYILYAKKVREEYVHLSDEDFCQRRLQVVEKILSWKFVYVTREFREFAEEAARRNLKNEIGVMRARAKNIAAAAPVAAINPQISEMRNTLS